MRCKLPNTPSPSIRVIKPASRKRLLTSLQVVELGGQDIAIQAARNFRLLRAQGITIRKTIDTVIATRCIESNFTLLHSDRDFEPFVQHLGLRSVLLET